MIPARIAYPVLVLTACGSWYLGATFAVLLPFASPLWAPVTALARVLTGN